MDTLHIIYTEARAAFEDTNGKLVGSSAVSIKIITAKPRFSTTIRSRRLFEKRFVRIPNLFFPLQLMGKCLIRSKP